MPRTSAPVVDPFGADEQPVVEPVDGLVLRPFERGDAPFVEAAFSDADIMRWHHFRIDTTEEAIEWVDRTVATWITGAAAEWLIAHEGLAVGRVALHADAERGTAEIAYWLVPEGRGRGCGTQAARWVTSWAHARGFHRVVLQHGVENTASCRVADRLDYRVEGIARGAEFHDGVWSDVHQHAHLAGDPLPALG